jgi:exopolysaccharide biosynthesis polyprenyl glycosylphosphotransferase
LNRNVDVDELRQKYGCRVEDVSALFELDADTENGDEDCEDSLRLRLRALCSHCRLYGAGTVIVSFDATSMRFIAGIVAVLSELPVRIQLLPSLISPFMQRSRIGHCGAARVLEFHSRPSSLLDRLIKRTFDLVLAVSGVVLLCPLFAVIALAIKYDTRGPVFFIQTRHGFNEEPIRVVKFRSMTTLEEGNDFRQATPADPRITRVGRVLRRTNLDELPQLFNVILGSMSIVGPRPHAIAHNHMFRSQIKVLARRHNVRPGITGWAQVQGYRGETDTYEKMRKRVELDLEYIDNWSLYLDIKIVVLTVFSKRAYLNAG